jgi:signal-transduction protein with cAMP-binding, CBS, and nucleotidyltransferase domain
VSASVPPGPGTPLGELALTLAAVVPEDATLQEVAGLMVASGSSAVLVGDAHSIVTERDVVRATARGAPRDSLARVHATDDPLLVLDSCRAIDALHAMLKYGVRNLVVVSEAPGGTARILNIAQAAAVVLEGTDLPRWLSGLRLALHVEVP